MALVALPLIITTINAPDSASAKYRVGEIVDLIRIADIPGPGGEGHNEARCVIRFVAWFAPYHTWVYFLERCTRGSDQFRMQLTSVERNLVLPATSAKFKPYEKVNYLGQQSTGSTIQGSDDGDWCWEVTAICWNPQKAAFEYDIREVAIRPSPYSVRWKENPDAKYYVEEHLLEKWFDPQQFQQTNPQYA